MKPNIQKKIYFPYNETFDYYYHCNMQLGQAEAFIKDRNKCKGGHWVLHTEIQYKEWRERRIIAQPKNNKEEDEIMAKIMYPIQRRKFPSFFDSSFVVKPADKRSIT